MPTDVADPGPEARNANLEPSEEDARARSGADARTGKNIVLCSDGTGNSGGTARGTNVWAIVNAVWRQPDAEGNLPARTQVTFYDDGVGTRQFILFKLLGGAFGWGYSRNIRDLYKALVSAYEPGDSIYLFGFSRGAYTVRGLAGLILKRGILDPRAFETSKKLDYAVRAVYAAYRDCYGSIFGMLRRWLRPDYTWAYKRHCTNNRIHDISTDADRKFPESVRIGTPIKFIGVWDTVDAVGVPVDELADILDLFVRYRFPNKTLHPNIERACHAVSMDDERKTFKPVMWTGAIEESGREIQDDRIEQVWFPGVHSNVGGGYPKNQVAEVALDWMMKRAEDHGLLFYKDIWASIRESANAHGQIYDSRAGLAAYYRYQPRNIEVICAEAKIKEPKIHLSALRRAARATAGYAPANLPHSIEVVGTHGEDKDLVEKIQSAVADSAQDRMMGSRRVSRYVIARRVLYALFVGYSLFIAGAAIWFRWFAAPERLPAAEPPAVIAYLLDGIAWILPDFLLGILEPLLAYARAHWIHTVAAVAVLVLFVVLKYLFERKSNWLALDAWRKFRDLVYP